VHDTATLLRNSPELGETHVIELALPDEAVAVEADENQIRQVVWNLATNGLRAMPDGGRLTLGAAEANNPSQGAVLTVTDEGVGIAAEDLDGIFQPFRGSFGKGSGLGLAIIHRIASDYGAKIDVQSQVGRGTTFRIIFPPLAAGHTAIESSSESAAAPAVRLDRSKRAS
jgi:signal transduction histidine kinase